MSDGPASPAGTADAGRRPRIAFFDYPDVFEDFYPHYGVDRHAFATTWAATANHAILRLLQREVGDVTWYELTLGRHRNGAGARHELGFGVRYVRSSTAHRALWRAYYGAGGAWRLPRVYPPFALAASYLAPVSIELREALAADRPDLLLTQDYSSGKFDVLLAHARRLRVPLVAFHAGSTPDRYVGRLAKRWTIRRADLVIASSATERELLIRRFRVRADRLAVILTPIDTDAFRPVARDDACAAAGLDPNRRYLLFVGRLSDHEKRVGALIQAFAALAGRYADADLLIVGEGRDGERLRAVADERAPGRVRFLGWRSGPGALAPLYAAAECLLLPSRCEGFPTVVGEAMACGTPVLASRVGGVPELVVEGRTGWLVPPGDDRALTDALDVVLADPARPRALRPAARAAAEERVATGVVGAALRERLGRLLAGRA